VCCACITPRPHGVGPDHTLSACALARSADGYNLPIAVRLTGGEYVPRDVAADFNCQTSLIWDFDLDLCPYELRVYSDQVGDMARAPDI
jgi:hypothetical protein